MAYATQADIEAIYSPDALYVADRDGDGVADAAAVTRALDAASAEIDSYLGVRHTLPLSETPAVLIQPCVDIALYRLALSRSVLTEEHRTRFEDAIVFLTRVANGKAALNLPAPVDPETGETTEFNSPRPIVSGGPSRVFGREETRGL